MPEADPRGEPVELALHHAWLVRFARRLARDESQAEDLAQEAWAELLARGAEAVRDLRAFLAGVVRVRAARQRADGAARVARERRAAQATALPCGAVLAERLELARVLAEELARLPAAQRDLLLLHHQEGLSLAAIARRSGIPAGTVRARVVRARAALREALDRRRGGRHAWTVLALARPAGMDTAARREVLLAGGTGMHVATKWSLGIAALAALAWWGTRSRTGTSRPPDPDEPGGVLVAAAPVPAPVAAEVAPAARAAAPDAAPSSPTELVLRFVDAGDGAPLPRFAVNAVRGTRDETLVSDESGELRLDLRRVALPLVLVGVDDVRVPLTPAQRVRVEEAVPGAPIDLAFRVGPTYRLAFDGAVPPGADVELSLRPGRAPDLGIGFRTRLRAGDPPWARLDPDTTRAAELGDGPWTLTARDRAGCWIAWGEVRQVAGCQPEPVAMHGELRGDLAVAATIGGAPIESVLSARVHRMADGAAEPEWVRRLTLYPASRPGFPGSGGAGRIPWLEPGVYRLRVGSNAHPDREEDVLVEPGGTTSVALDFPLRADLVELEVVLRSETGRTALGGLSLVARDPEGRERPRFAHFGAADDDGSVRYRFDELAPIPWDVELDPAPWLPPWDRTRVRIAPGEPAPELLCLDADAPPAFARGVRVVDASTGEPLEGAGVRTYVEGVRHVGSRTGTDGVARIGPYPRGRRVEVHVRAAGHVGALLELDFTEDPPGVPREIALERGWGTLFEVSELTAAGRQQPLAGVEVLLDGRAVATTDAAGRAFVRADARPERIELARPGYRHAFGDLSPNLPAATQRELYPLHAVLQRVP